jgi:hypothetical protein
MHIAIKRADGGVSIMNIIRQVAAPSGKKPSKAEAAKARRELIEEEVAKWTEKHPGQYVSFREIDPAHIPQDRTFRNAWTDDRPTATIDVDMEKARPIHMNRLRAVRNEKLKSLDVPYQIAMETGAEAERREIAARKQALRDLPANTDLSTILTPEELATFVPDVLA